MARVCTYLNSTARAFPATWRGVSGRSIFLAMEESPPLGAGFFNFARNTEEAFTFYKSVFGGDFIGDGISRLGDIPRTEGMPPLAEEDKNLIMHIELPILGGHVLMGTDAPESMEFTLHAGNSIHLFCLNLIPNLKLKDCLMLYPVVEK